MKQSRLVLHTLIWLVAVCGGMFVVFITLTGRLPDWYRIALGTAIVDPLLVLVPPQYYELAFILTYPIIFLTGFLPLLAVCYLIMALGGSYRKDDQNQ